MKKVTVDLNVLLDFLNKRAHHEEAAQIIELCVSKKIEGYLCAHEFTTLSYFLVKEHKNNERVRHVLMELLDIFTTLPVSEAVLRESLNSPIKDFEDAVIEVSSLIGNVEYIITRNMSDFKTSRVKAITAGEFFRLYHSQ